MSLRLFDLGGSGVKTVKLPNLQSLGNVENARVVHYKTPKWNNFPEWANSAGLLDAEFLGISCAGFVVPDEKVKLFRVADWHDREIVKELLVYTPNSTIFLLNDAESHLMAHAELHNKPQMSISLGTSLGFAISDT